MKDYTNEMIIIRKCSVCGKLIADRPIYYGNTHGARYWTDGKREAPRLPDHFPFANCPHCNNSIWIEEQTEVGEINPILYPDQDTSVFIDARPCNIPRLKDYYSYLLQGVSNRNKEKYLRLRAWWAGNDQRRGIISGKTMSVEEISNLHVYATLLDEKDRIDAITKAEVLRELGMFLEAKALIDDISCSNKDFSKALVIIRGLADQRVTTVNEMKFNQRNRADLGKKATTVQIKKVEFDQISSCLQPSVLLVVACEPGTITRTLAVSIVLHAGVQEKKNIAIFSQYIRQEEWILNLLSRISAVKKKVLLSGLITKDDWIGLSRAIDILSNSQIFINHEVDLKFSEIRDEILCLDSQNGIDLIIVDDRKNVQHHTGSMMKDDYVGSFHLLKSLAEEIMKPIIMFVPPARLQEYNAGIEYADLVTQVDHCTNDQEDDEPSDESPSKDTQCERGGPIFFDYYDRINEGPTEPCFDFLPFSTGIKKLVKEAFHELVRRYNIATS